MLICDVPGFAAHNAPAHAAIHFEGRSIGYRAFAERCARLARALATLAPRGARVAVLSTNRIEFMECYFGIPGAAMIMTPLNIRQGARDLGHIVADAEPAVVIVEPAFLGLLDALRAQLPDGVRIVVLDDAPQGCLGYEELLAAAPDGPRPEPSTPDAPAWLMYTSGTTGRSKGAVMSHRSVLASVTNTMCAFDFGRDDTSLFMFPMFHIAGYALLGYMLRGNPIVLMRGFEVGAYLANVARYRITQHAIAPTMLAMVLEDPRVDDHDTSSLRQIAYGASAMPPEIIRAAMARWPHVGFGTGFGMTELCGNVVYLSRDEHLHALEREPSVLASCGRPMPLAQVRIIDDAGRDVPEGATGELAVRGDQVFSGYWRNEAATRESFVDGWFRTGDIGRRDAQGRFYVVDRKKDMIITGGENVYSREVEDLLYEHPAVAEAAVVGERDPKWGEKVVALVRLRSGASADADALDAFCRKRIGGYKRPRRYIFVDELPKSAAGKILKAELRRRLNEIGE